MILLVFKEEYDILSLLLQANYYNNLYEIHF